MAPFLVPGLELDDVLAAAATDRGRELYTNLITAVAELTAYVRELGDHDRDRADAETASTTSSAPAPPSDPPAAAPAPASSSPGEIPLLQPGRGVTREVADRTNNKRRIVADYFAARPGQWIAPRSVVADTGLSANIVGAILNTLLEAELLEHNGAKRTAARYRKPLPTDEDLEDRRRFETGSDPLDTDPLDPHPIPAGDGQAAAAAARAAAVPALSGRTRRALEREQRERRAEETRRRNLARRNGSLTLSDGGTLEGRLTIALGRRLERGATLPELANELNIADGAAFRELADTLGRLEDDGETRRAGRRNGHVIYVATRPEAA